MIQSVTIDNFLGERVTCDLDNPFGHGLNVTGVDGIAPENIGIVTQDLALLDGSVYSSSRAPEREITISFRFLGVGTDDVEQTRHRLYRCFGGLGRPVRLHFQTEDNVLYIDGLVKSSTADIFSDSETAAVTIVCPDPWFRSETVLKTVVFDHINEGEGFEFDAKDYGYEIQNRIEFGSYDSRYAFRDSVSFEVYNPGDRDIGCIIRAMCTKNTDVDGSIKLMHISFENSTTGELSMANLSTEKDEVLEFHQWDIYEMNSIPGYKMINFYKYGVTDERSHARVSDTYKVMPALPWEQVPDFFSKTWAEQAKLMTDYRERYAGWFPRLTEAAYPMGYFQDSELLYNGGKGVPADTYTVTPHLNLYDRNHKWFKLQKGWNTVQVGLRSGHWGDSKNELPNFEVSIEYEPMYEGV